MSTRMIALDTETTGLDPKNEEIFEIAVVDMITGTEKVWRIEPDPYVVKTMHPKAAEVNRYHERTSADDWEWSARHGDLDALDQVLEEIHVWLDGAHIFGAVPDFDTRFLAQLFDENWREVPRWHYHLIDIENVGVGFLLACANMMEMGGRQPVADMLRAAATPPYDSDDLSSLLDVPAADEDNRHTALGDARWVARWWHKMYEKQPESKVIQR